MDLMSAPFHPLFPYLQVKQEVQRKFSYQGPTSHFPQSPSHMSILPLSLCACVLHPAEPVYHEYM
jgi:hypothetical protein